MIARGAKSGRRFFCASVCALSLTLTACSTRSSPVAPADPDFALPTSEIEIKWSAAVGAIEFDFVDDDRICVGDGAGALAAVDLQSGAVEILASGDLPELRYMSLAPAISLSPPGAARTRRIWPRSPPPASVGGSICRRGWSRRRWRGRVGFSRWRQIRFRLSMPRAASVCGDIARRARDGFRRASMRGLNIADGVIYAGFRGGLLAAFAPATGDALWESTVADLPGGHEIDTALNIVKPAAVADAVCAAGFRAGFACATRAQGRVLWRRAGSTLLRAAAADDILFVVEENRGSRRRVVGARRGRGRFAVADSAAAGSRFRVAARRRFRRRRRRRQRRPRFDLRRARRRLARGGGIGRRARRQSRAVGGRRHRRPDRGRRRLPIRRALSCGIPPSPSSGGPMSANRRFAID